MHTSNEIILKHATTITIPRESGGRVIMIKVKTKWIIIGFHGPSWFWNEENGWEISLNSSAKATEYDDMVKAFELAITLPNIRD